MFVDFLMRLGDSEVLVVLNEVLCVLPENVWVSHQEVLVIPEKVFH